MRLFFAVLCALIVLGTALFGEAEDPYSVQVVKNLLRMPAGISTGFSEKQMERLGDRTAIAILKIYSSHDLEEPPTIKKILPVIRASFAYPELILLPEDRKPDVTLLLLRHLKEVIHSADLKQEVAAVADFVEQKTGAKRPNR